MQRIHLDSQVCTLWKIVQMFAFFALHSLCGLLDPTHSYILFFFLIKFSLEINQVICNFIRYGQVDHPVHQMEAEESYWKDDSWILVNIWSLHSEKSLWRRPSRSRRWGRRTAYNKINQREIEIIFF